MPFCLFQMASLDLSTCVLCYVVHARNGTGCSTPLLITARPHATARSLHKQERPKSTIRIPSTARPHRCCSPRPALSSENILKADIQANVNSNFNAQLSHRLSLLPEPSDPPSELDLRRREDCLSQFYADWQIANRDSQLRWVKEWWREVWAGLRMQGKIYLVRAFRR